MSDNRVTKSVNGPRECNWRVISEHILPVTGLFTSGLRMNVATPEGVLSHVPVTQLTAAHGDVDRIGKHEMKATVMKADEAWMLVGTSDGRLGVFDNRKKASFLGFLRLAAGGHEFSAVTNITLVNNIAAVCIGRSVVVLPLARVAYCMRKTSSQSEYQIEDAMSVLMHNVHSDVVSVASLISASIERVPVKMETESDADAKPEFTTSLVGHVLSGSEDTMLMICDISQMDKYDFLRCTDSVKDTPKLDDDSFDENTMVACVSVESQIRDVYVDGSYVYVITYEDLMATYEFGIFKHPEPTEDIRIVHPPSRKMVDSIISFTKRWDNKAPKSNGDAEGDESPVSDDIVIEDDVSTPIRLVGFNHPYPCVIASGASGSVLFETTGKIHWADKSLKNIISVSPVTFAHMFVGCEDGVVRTNMTDEKIRWMVIYKKKASQYVERVDSKYLPKRIARSVKLTKGMFTPQKKTKSKTTKTAVGDSQGETETEELC